MIEILLFSIITNLMFYSYGNLTSHKKNTNRTDDLIKKSIIGIIIVSLISLFANFLIPLNKLFNTSLLIIGLTILLYQKKLKFNKNEIIFILVSGLVTFSLLIFSNNNRPDAGLYHLPYTNILNDYKIIFGVSNIHFRFGHISIMQYLSAINNNYLFGNSGIVIPLASSASFFIIYFFNNVLGIFRNKNEIDLSKVFSIFVIIFISYKINRYSSFGNDALAHLSFFYLISILLKKDKPELNFIYLICVFIFLNKPLMIIVFIIPLLIFIRYYNRKNLKLLFSMPTFLLILWLTKNIAVSGCAIYPVKITCINSLKWTDLNEVHLESRSGEAWSKGWPDRKDNNISFNDYNKNFNWYKTWSKKHGKFIVSILFPYILVALVIAYLISGKSKSDFKMFKNFDFFYFISFFVSIIGSLIFFLKFPIFRYGYSFLVSSIILSTFFAIQRINLKNITKITKVIFLICIVAFFGKQAVRSVKNYSNKDIWPNIYSFNKNIKPKISKVNISNYLDIYTTNHLCMYNKSPCTNYKLKNINIEKKQSYLFINLSEK
ncbi:MAG: LIC_10190 family membrane protein [Candidatus Pelagibacter sp.]